MVTVCPCVIVWLETTVSAGVFQAAVCVPVGGLAVTFPVLEIVMCQEGPLG